MSLKTILKKSYGIRTLGLSLHIATDTLISKCQVINKGCAKLNKDIKGNNNKIVIGRDSFVQNCQVRIHGNNNKILIGGGTHIGHGCSLWIDGDNIEINIGNNVTMSRDVQLCAQESGRRITVGEDCMFSNNIIVRTSDSHPIFDKESDERENYSRDAFIGKHVWIAPNSKIFKGVSIGEGAVIGSDTLVTKDVPAYSLAVGHPAKIVRSGIKWTRDDIF